MADVAGYIFFGLIGLGATALLAFAIRGVIRTIIKRNRPATPEEREAFLQRQRDAQPTSQDIASRNRTNAIANECARVRAERARIIDSGSTQPMPEYPRGTNGEFIC